jgi:putative ABC transport system ATP-binding protein
MSLFHDIHQKGNTIILVTHEEDIARHAHRIVRLRDGKVESDTVNEHPVVDEPVTAENSNSIDAS